MTKYTVLCVCLKVFQDLHVLIKVIEFFFCYYFPFSGVIIKQNDTIETEL